MKNTDTMFRYYSGRDAGPYRFLQPLPLQGSRVEVSDGLLELLPMITILHV